MHWGLGHGCGELAGGFMISAIGAKYTFGIFGVISFIDLFLFIVVNEVHEKCCPEEEPNDTNLKDYSPIPQKPCCGDSIH